MNETKYRGKSRGDTGLIELGNYDFLYLTPLTPVKKNNLWPSPSLIGGDKQMIPPEKEKGIEKVVVRLKIKTRKDWYRSKV